MPYLLVFFCSFITLSFEILLIRIFSIRLSHHYASLIISLSMAGLVVGSLAAFFKQRSSKPLNPSSSQALQRLAAALVASCPVVFITLSVIPLDHVRMLWEKVQIVYFVLFILLCTIPFLLYGAFIAFSLSVWRDKANKVYASDLIGGAAGLLLVAILMNLLRTEYVFAVTIAVTGLAILAVLENTLSKIIAGSIFFILCLLVVLDVSAIKMSPHKGLVQALKVDGATHVTTIYTSHSRLDLFENPQMKFAPGLSLGYTQPVPKGLGVALDGEIAGVIMGGKQQESYDFLSYVPSALPYLLLQPKNVVIVGAKNGIDLLQSLFFGAFHISVTEYDASVLQAFASIHDEYSPRTVYFFHGSARRLLRSLPQEPDIILLSRTGFFPSGNFGLQEDYDLTVEAITSYIKGLKKNGILFVQMFLQPPPRNELRLVMNIRAALNKMGVAGLSKQLLIYRSWDTVNLLVKKDGFSETDLNKIGQFLSNRQFDILYPGMAGQEKFITGLDYEALFNKILVHESSADFSSSYVFDIRETTDDRPFFHYYLKLSNIREIYRISGRKWPYLIHEGMFLPFVLIFLVVIAIGIFGSTLLFLKKRGAGNLQLKAGLLIYFTLIGFAFMFTEIFFIHRLILPLGSPVRAFSITLVTILMSSGIGSMLTVWFIERKMIWIIGLTPLIVIANYIIFDIIDETALSVFSVVPIGILLGLFFPVGLRFLVSKETDGGVPLAYAANGTASIIAPSLASLVAVSCGCSILLILAAIFYALAIVILLFATRRISWMSKHTWTFLF